MIDAFSLAIQSNYDWSFNAMHVRCRGIGGIGLMFLAVAYRRIRRKINSFEALLCLHSRVCIETPKCRCVWGEEDGTENRWGNLHFFSICSSFFNVLDVIKQVIHNTFRSNWSTHAMKICPGTFAKWKAFCIKKAAAWKSHEVKLNCGWIACNETCTSTLYDVKIQKNRYCWSGNCQFDMMDGN